jgi:hypothetical protein
MTPDLLGRIGTALWGFGWPHQLNQDPQRRRTQRKTVGCQCGADPVSIAPELVRELKRHAGLCYSLVSEMGDQGKNTRAQ